MKSKFLIFGVSLFLCACTTGARLDTIANYHASENYDKIIETNSDSDNLSMLLRADATFHKNDFETSDKTFEKINKKEINSTKTSFGIELTKLAGGQMATEYKPYMMDLLFVSYYQIWGALADNRFDDARVVINQSYSRQKKMSIEYQSLIKDKENDAKREKVKEALAVSTANWSAYGDIMNPALTYLSGLYFLNIGETENARQYFARASGMVPENDFIKTDLTTAENGNVPNHTAWIFIETGYAPRLREKRIDIPWIVGRDIQVISVAVSDPQKNENFSTPPKSAKLLTDVDALFMTEFKEYQINEALRAFAKTISNMAVQKATSDKLNGFGNLIGTVYTVATTTTEIRSWVALPKRIYLLRVQKDKSGTVKLNTGYNLNLGYNGNDLVYIRGNDIKTIKIKN